MSGFTPTLRVGEVDGRVTLGLDGFFSAEGATLQEAADELVRKMLLAVMALRSGGISGLSAVSRPDMALVVFLWELGEIDVFDGGADGQAETTGDNTLFERQGVFVP